ncbi:MAG: DNA polymerase Y family protein [Planctomycetota bacterium]|nr:MAG: DNA polymerase Y family protein [Planctomycetota bacterium]REJ90746.1 MAG: DNA polymerase Y family protein [Planctomycetota bacterium]REK26708.1 MAG: DNA polymerase Y family protein [Planctomycetota bacterium]REK35631.1 MAG: DNA polymerase Y family protein [Planctomycetota bacterium]
MCAWFPNWPLQRIRYAQPEHKRRTIVLFADTGRTGLQVVACCPSAAERGIVPGMPLAEAEGIAQAARRPPSKAPLFLPHQPEDDLSGLQGLAGWCGRFSPVVGIEEPDSLLLDLSGCGPLFGGERRLSMRLAHALARWGFSARTAITETIGAAWALAHFAEDRLTVIPPREHEAALRPLPTQALRLPATATEILEELDIRRIEQLLALPRSSLISRVGPEVLQRLDQALGITDERITPVRTPEPVQASEQFEHPLRDRKALEIVLRRLVERITETTGRNQQGIQRLEIHIAHPAGPPTNFTIGTLRPSRSAAHLMELIETRLEQTPIPEEICGVRVEAAAIAVLEAHQNQLFDTGGNPAAARELARLIDRISNRLGKQQVVRAQLCPEAQPELSVRWEPVLDSFGDPADRPPAPPHSWLASCRPLRLRTTPLAVQVISVVPQGPPIRFFSEGAVHTVARCWGPERIETGWWRGKPIRRDYYRVETRSGRHCWLFRTPSGGWFLHGEFE